MDREQLDICLLALWQGEPLNAEEEEAVRQWLEESDEHRLYYSRLKIDYLRQRWVMREGLIRRKSEKRYCAFARKRKIMYRWTMVAASVSLLLVTGLFFYLWQPLQTAGNDDIVPGSARAKLYLSSGEEIVLSDVARSIDEGDARIDVTDYGTLTYENRFVDESEDNTVNRLVVERGGEYKLLLSDGSEVWINSASEVEYPVRFAGQRRVVHLKGEAYFKVYADASRPFVVVANGVEVSALGTEFNVNTYTERFVKSVLVRGKICVGKEESQVVLNPDQLAVYDRQTGRTEVKDVDVRKYIDWKSGDFIFSDDRLEEVMEKIALWYDCRVVFADETLKDMLMSGNMRRYESVERFLYYLKITTGARYEIKDRTIFIYAR